MIIHSAEYSKSCSGIKDCPLPNMPEYAFIGRSNVGKSSLINMLVNRKNLALTSSKPGKTKTINYFLINKSWYLVDMPGMGFAHTSKKNREQWQKMTFDYFVRRKNLMCVFVLIDSRIALQGTDIILMFQLSKNGIPFVAVSTKTDKITAVVLLKHIQSLHVFFDTYWEERPIHIISSAPEKKGRDEILRIIDETNQQFAPPKY